MEHVRNRYWGLSKNLVNAKDDAEERWYPHEMSHEMENTKRGSRDRLGMKMSLAAKLQSIHMRGYERKLTLEFFLDDCGGGLLLWPPIQLKAGLCSSIEDPHMVIEGYKMRMFTIGNDLQDAGELAIEGVRLGRVFWVADTTRVLGEIIMQCSYRH
ncbi:hypothetical protein K432DRAFT_463516 [Lepidopterella palustris CBS 459.81]|uniref:Uncharacterized protein n=1 Tax=Lepidopterella palustris CBS 459.81 TaxID=1314670 RepID=A0A8E2JIX9_9PEZI|nr:hypothetical protein K432DRAFT_463516 [Lepidopterella palustris CBS 459.81]